MRYPARVRPLSRDTIARLFEAAMIDWSTDKQLKDGWLNSLERYTRLVESELQGQVYDAAHRASPTTGRVYKKRMPKFG